MSVKIGAGKFPSCALRIGAKDESSLGGADKKKEVSFLHTRMAHVVHGGNAWRIGGLIGIRRTDDYRAGLNRLQRRLHFARPLVALHWLFGETFLDYRPQARRNRRTERLRDLAHDCRADFESS